MMQVYVGGARVLLCVQLAPVARLRPYTTSLAFLIYSIPAELLSQMVASDFSSSLQWPLLP